MRLIIISGRSGAGKSTALHVLEDAGFNCIDNLPATLLPELVKNLEKQPQEQPCAVSIDARNSLNELEQFPELLKQVKSSGTHCEVLFLDAKSATLIKRFSETRRKHPQSSHVTDLSEAIQLERELLDPIISAADLTIDTSNLNLHELRDLIKKRITQQNHDNLSLQFQSFGFKHGIPIDVDFVFDVRCLPNPYWKAHLRKHTGQEQPVIDFLSGEEDVQSMLNDISDFIKRWLPKFIANNRSYLTVAIGCTGGQHRSVFLCEQLHSTFKDIHDNTQIRHRELSSAR
jgi:UPF0042 nucleotide-binding protein